MNRGLVSILTGAAIIFAFAMTGGFLTQNWYSYEGIATLPVAEASELIDQHPNVSIVESSEDAITVSMKFNSQQKELYGIKGDYFSTTPQKVLGYAIPVLVLIPILYGFIIFGRGNLHSKQIGSTLQSVEKREENYDPK